MGDGSSGAAVDLFRKFALGLDPFWRTKGGSSPASQSSATRADGRERIVSTRNPAPTPWRRRPRTSPRSRRFLTSGPGARGQRRTNPPPVDDSKSGLSRSIRYGNRPLRSLPSRTSPPRPATTGFRAIQFCSHPFMPRNSALSPPPTQVRLSPCRTSDQPTRSLSPRGLRECSERTRLSARRRLRPEIKSRSHL